MLGAACLCADVAYTQMFTHTRATQGTGAFTDTHYGAARLRADVAST
jgi:hypothetical protein